MLLLCRLSARDLDYPNRHRSEYRQQAGECSASPGAHFLVLVAIACLALLIHMAIAISTFDLMRGSLRSLPKPRSRKSQSGGACFPTYRTGRYRDDVSSRDVSCDAAC